MPNPTNDLVQYDIRTIIQLIILPAIGHIMYKVTRIDRKVDKVHDQAVMTNGRLGKLEQRVEDHDKQDDDRWELTREAINETMEVKRI